jgi:hypothetical protein
MPKYAAWYDWNDPSNTELMDAMARLRHLAVKSENVTAHTKRPGSLEGLQAVTSAIDF